MASGNIRATEGVRQTRSCVPPSSRRGRMLAFIHIPPTSGAALPPRWIQGDPALPQAHRQRRGGVVSTITWFESWDALKRFNGARITKMQYIPLKAREVLARFDER